jgi:two-component system response regulator DevR
VSPDVTVCLVEDHAMLREQLCELLADSGIEVLAAVGTMREGEAAVITHRPDVAVIDNRLPDGRGIDLVRTLALADLPVTLLLHSATATTADVREALQAGAAAVIVKTIAGDNLLAAIRRLPPRSPVLKPGDD